MTIESGQTLLHYRLIEQIGVGGMGVVWKALDTTLDREVAIKFLPAGFADDRERLARFEREAKLLASLNHPHIAGIYGLHEADGENFLAMELIGGEDLAERLQRGPMPLDMALSVAQQVTEALETAHDNGIVHRDLKPANVRLTADGKAKVLDFGLAKGLDGTPDIGSDSSLSPTMTSLGTVAGVILGTAAYMSPEQARGQAADRRSDVWSFGVMFYEMLSGRRPFEGGTISDTLAAVLRADPDWERLPEDYPSSVRELLRRCLNKDPRRRMQSIGEARVRIEETIEDPSSADVAADPTDPTTAAGGKSSRVPWILATVAILGCVGLGVAWQQSAAPAAPAPIRARIALEPRMGTASADLFALPGGSSFLYTTKNNRLIHEFSLSSLDATPLAGTENAIIGDLSPEGGWIVYFDFGDGSLRKIPRTGGVSVVLAPASSNPRGASWATDGFIYYAPGAVDGIWRIREDGGEPEQVTTTPHASEDVRSQIDSHRWPTVLPGNRALLYLAGASGDFGSARVELLDLVSKETRVLQTDAMYPRYLTDGRIAFVHAGTLMTMGFDVERLEVTSAATASVEGVAHSFGNGGAEYSVSDDGTLIYQPGQGSQVAIELQWLDAGGQSSTITGPEPLYHPRFSPDGTRLTFTRGAGSSQDIWIYDIERKTETRLTLDSSATDNVACWSPDGKWVTYSSKGGGGSASLYRVPADGSSAPVRLMDSNRHTYPSDWSSDSSMLLIYEFDTQQSWDLKLQHFDADGRPEGEPIEVAVSSGNETHGSFSPDDRFILYTSAESGSSEIYLKMVDGDGRWQVSDTGGITSRWGPGGETIYYQKAWGVDGEIRRVDVTFDDGVPRLGRPQTVVSHPISMIQTLSGSFDVHPIDGRFVVAASMWGEMESLAPVMIQDWFETD